MADLTPSPSWMDIFSGKATDKDGGKEAEDSKNPKRP